jgi:hypothetical protein
MKSVPLQESLMLNTRVNNKQSLHSKHLLDVIHVSLVNCSEISQIPFTLGSLLGQDMTLESVFSSNFPGSGQSKSFFSAGINLHFWHFLFYLCVTTSFSVWG